MNPKVSFSVIDEDTIISKEYTTYFRSVIAFGKEAKHKEITGCTHASIFAIDIDHITGKEAIEYVNARRRK